MPPRSFARTGAVLALAILLGSVACAGGPSGSASPAAPNGTAAPGPACPVVPVRVVVSVDQWSDIVRQLGGQCTQVTTVLANGAADPHDFEPTAGDLASFGNAQLVVLNGAGYDGWAAKAVDTLSSRPPVVDAGAVVGAGDGANPHLWYSPAAVDDVAAAVTARLRELSPGASAYFDERAVAWNTWMQPYGDAIAAVKQRSEGGTCGATESVYDLMAQAVGLRDMTPTGYQRAVMNESEPAPGMVHEFEQDMKAGSIKVLFFNPQTEGAMSEQVRDAARTAGIPVVEVTESAPAGTSFVDWQVAQLRDLEAALGPPGT